MLRPRSFRAALLVVGLCAAAVACNDDGRTMRTPDADKNASISVPSTTEETEPPLIDVGTEDTLVGEPIGDLAVTAPWADGAPIPAKYTCGADDVSPALSWPAAPPGTIEIAITMTDDDAPQYVHWALAGLEPSTTAIGEATVPDSAIEATNSAGKVGYSGPCPPAGATHTYRIEVHYLSQQLEVAAGEPAAEMMMAIRSATYSTATVTGAATWAPATNASTTTTTATS